MDKVKMPHNGTTSCYISKNLAKQLEKIRVYELILYGMI